MNIKKILGLLFCVGLLWAATGCMKIQDVSFEKEPAATAEPSPSPSASAEATQEPSQKTEASQEPSQIVSPSNIEELSIVIGMDVYEPIFTIDGYELTSIGYDGEEEGALKYQNGADVLMYTFKSGRTDLSNTETAEQGEVAGLPVLFQKEGKDYVAAVWNKGNNTYRVYANPGVSFDALQTAIEGMMKAPLKMEESKETIKVSSVEELSTLIGIPVNLPSRIPEQYELKKITAYRKETARITFEKEGQAITFCKCEGTQLPKRIISENLLPVESIQKKGLIVQCYSADQEQGVTLAEWTKDGFSYSICVTNTEYGTAATISKAVMKKLITNF